MVEDDEDALSDAEPHGSGDWEDGHAKQDTWDYAQREQETWAAKVAREQAKAEAAQQWMEDDHDGYYEIEQQGILRQTKAYWIKTW